MDFRGAGDPLIFFGPLRGAANPSNSARGGGGVDPKILENRKGVLELPLGIPSESPTAPPALNRRHLLVISRMCGGIPGFRSRFRASSRGFPRKFLDGMAQN